MALANADPVKYKPQIEAIAKYIISAQHATGQWDYPNGVGNGDTSISQYGILGLWEAARAGVAVPKRVWDKAASWHVTNQLRDGSFTYHPAPPSPDGVTLGMPGTHSMTAAGTASLLVCRLHLYPGASDPEAKSARARKKNRAGKKYGILIPAAPDAEEGSEVAEDSRAVESNYKITTRLASIDKAVQKGRDWMDRAFHRRTRARRTICITSTAWSGCRPSPESRNLTVTTGTRRERGISWRRKKGEPGPTVAG